MKQSVSNKLISIFFIRMSSSAGFAVFFSGLSLLLTKQKYLSLEMATTLTGLFFSLNYFLPLIGGVIAKYFDAYKKLYCIANIFSIVGCLILANEKYLYFGLSFILINSLLSNVCIKMFVTNLFNEDQVKERKSAFLWNYVSMNTGYLLGFFICGYFFIQNNISVLFYIMSCLFSLSLLLTIIFIKNDCKDSTTVMRDVTVAGILLSISTIIASLLTNADVTQKCLSVFSILLICIVSLYGYSFSKNDEKNNFMKFIGFSLLNIVFWAVYMLTPIAFMQLIENGVNRVVGGYEVAPQWFMNIDSIVILCASPIFSLLVKKVKPNNIFYYTAAFLISCLAILALLLGFHTVTNFKVPALSMLACLILLAVAELNISPIGDSLIGELISKPLRSIMTGFLSLNIGVGVILSTYIAKTLLIPYLNNDGIFDQNVVKIQQSLTYIASSLFLVGAVLLLSRYLKQSKKNIQITKEYNYE